MKRLILAIFGLSAVIGLAMYVNRPHPPSISLTEPSADSAPAPADEGLQARPVVSRSHELPQLSNELRAPNPASSATVTSSEPRPTDVLALKYFIDILVSPQAAHEQKQATWKHLREAGKLDQTISELERRAADDPRTAAYPAVLGQAYLQKCGTIQDIREQGILAMQADKVFDTALNLDPSNWEARFTKAVAMSYWPVNLNKGQEVIEHFQTLVQQQETQAPQPQFAETYLWLGDQYQKAGQTDDAHAIWQRGAALFPNHDKLRSRLTPAP